MLHGIETPQQNAAPGADCPPAGIVFTPLEAVPAGRAAAAGQQQQPSLDWDGVAASCDPARVAHDGREGHLQRAGAGAGAEVGAMQVDISLTPR